MALPTWLLPVFTVQTISSLSYPRNLVLWPTFTDVDGVIEYAIKNYEVDKKRIYLTGLSMGGGAVWEYAGADLKYAKKLAAIVPICGASYPWIGRSQVYSSGKSSGLGNP